MKPPAIIGIGSPYGDDQVGWRVIEHLQHLPEADKITILTRDRPGIRLLEDLEGRRSTILIDAVQSGAPAGTLHDFDVGRLDKISTLTSSHGFGLAETLSLGKALGILPVTLSIYGIEIEPEQTACIGVPLTPAVAAGAKRLTHLLASRISKSS